MYMQFAVAGERGGDGLETLIAAELDRFVQDVATDEAQEQSRRVFMPVAPPEATCQHGVPGCKCAVGWPPAEQCPDCREDEPRASYCVCGPKDVNGRIFGSARPPGLL